MRFILIALASLAAATFSAAQDGRWTLVQSIGEVTVEEPGVSRIAVKPNARLNEGATLTTGANGRAILTDGRSSIAVAPNSRIELPAADDENVTSIRQDFGTAIFKVQKKPSAHFEVQTPYLAAVVKGTTFEVTVDAMGASVDVEEGLVDVGAAASGERALVPGGQRIRVLRSGRFDGGRPADMGRDRQSTAALNVISVEIAPESDTVSDQGREFAALQPKFEERRTLEDRILDQDRNGDEGSSAAPPPEPSDDGGAPRGPDPTPPGSGGNVITGGPVSGPSRTGDDDDDDRTYDRSKWAAYFEKLKKAYADWKSRHHDDDHDHDRDDDDDDD
jgi:hypothetical protein